MNNWGSLTVMLLGWLLALAWGIQGGEFVAWFLSYSLGFMLLYSLCVRGGALRATALLHDLSAEKIGAGEDVVVNVYVRQRSWFPPAWIVIEDEWTCISGGKSIIYRKLVVPWFQSECRYRYQLSQMPRGTYILKQGILYSGDSLGLLRKRVVHQLQHSICVYPKPVSIALGAFRYDRRGGTGTNLSLTSDGINGVRHYVSGDPMNRVDWKASAKTGELRTKQFASEKTERVRIVLDNFAHTYAPLRNGDGFEYAIQLAAGLLQDVTERRIAAEFIFMDAKPRVLPVTDRSEMMSAFEQLGSMALAQMSSFPEMLNYVGTMSGIANHHCICISAQLDETTLSALNRMQQGGSSITLLHITSKPALPIWERRLKQLLDSSRIGYMSIPVAPGICSAEGSVKELGA